MFSALRGYFYGIRGHLGRSEILFFAKRCSKKLGYSKRPILGKKAQNRDIGPTHMLLKKKVIPFAGLGGKRNMFQFPPNPIHPFFKKRVQNDCQN